MKLTEIALKRPVTSLMLFVTLLLIGLIAGRKVPLEFFPDITFPGILVQIPYNGSTPEEVEQLITRPVEEVLATVSGINRMNSTSGENNASIFMMMEMGTDVTLKSIEVREKIDGIRHLLPADVERVIVRKFSASDDAILTLRLSSEEDLSRSYEMLERNLKNPLERIEGVSRVNLYGVNKRQIRIELDAGRIAAYKVDLTHLSETLRRSNFSLTAGKLEDEGKRYTVRPVGEITSIEELQNIIIGPNNLRVKDIADVRYDIPELQLVRRLDQKPAIGLDIYKESGGNTVAIAEQVLKDLEGIRENPEMKGIQIYEMNNQAYGIKSSLNELLKAGMVGAGLSFLVLLFFLRSLTTTLIVALAVPFSLTVTIGALYFLGLSLNILSMMGLMLAVGMLVDNAVVVTENIHRHQQSGGTLTEGTLSAVKEVGMAVIAGTLTTIIVFLPNIISQSDMTAVYLKHVAVTIVIALISSLLISLTIIPLLTSRLRQKPPSNKKNIIDRMAERYSRILRWLMTHRWTSAGLVLLVIGSVVIPAQAVKMDMFPNTESRELRLFYNLNANYAMDKLGESVAQIEAYLYENKDSLDIKQVYTFYEPGFALSTIMLVDEKDATLSLDEIRKRIREGMPKLSTGNPQFEFTSRTGMESLRVYLLGDSSEELVRLANETARRFQSLPGLTDVRTEAEAGKEEVQILIDRERSNTIGLNSMEVATIVSGAMRGQNLRRIRSREGETDVILAFQDVDRQSLSDLQKITVATVNGEAISLGSIADFNIKKGPQQVSRTDRSTSLFVTANLDGITMEEARRRIEQVMNQINYPPGYAWSYGRSFSQGTETMNAMLINMLLALALIYLVMASLFESTIFPSSIITSILFAVIGVFWFFMITGTTFDFMAMIGILILMGIVVNNGIVLIDHINHLRNSGLDRIEAIVQGGRDRMRPILMTAGTTVLGLIPLCIGTTQIGGDGPPYFPMARAIVGGLIFATLISMIILPTLYLWLDDLKNWAHRIIKA